MILYATSKTAVQRLHIGIITIGSCAQIPGNHAPRKKWWDATLEVSWLGWDTGYPLFVGDAFFGDSS